MKKLLSITSSFIIALALSGVVLAKQTASMSTKKHNTQAVRSSLTKAKGRVEAVNLSARTLTLMEDGKSVTFHFDENTKITEAGKTIQPAAITSGLNATVNYTERDGRKMASAIHLRPAKATKPHKATKSHKDTATKHTKPRY